VTNMIGKPPGRDVFEGEENTAVEQWFGTISNSMITLSIFLTFDDWSTPARLVNEKYGWMEYFWVWYLVMGGFFIVSLLTGLMADQMMGAREESESADSERLEANDIAKKLEKLRRHLGHDERLDLNGFKELMKHDDMHQILEATMLAEAGQRFVGEQGEQHIKWIFDSIDRNGDHELTYTEIRRAFRQIARHANAKGMASVLEVMKLEGRLAKLDRTMEKQYMDVKNDPNAENSWDRRLERVHATSNLLRERVLAVEDDLKRFFQAQDFQPDA